MKESAVVPANHKFMTPNGKTVHGLVRGSDRFRVVAVVDPELAGRDAGEVLVRVRGSWNMPSCAAIARLNRT